MKGFCTKSRSTTIVRQWPNIVAAVLAASAVDAHAAGLEEVIVTAQKRAENAQDIPVSIVAFDTGTIAEARLTDVQAIAEYTPNIVIANTSATARTITIRGIGTNLAEAGAQDSVGLTIDDVALTRKGAASLDMFDVERIEVLRGPQGTLYGKNVVGGAINVINNRPVMENDAFVEVGAGDYSLFEARGMFNTPINEDTAVRAVVNYQKRDGYIDNEYVYDAAETNPDPFNNFGPCTDCKGDMDDVDNISGRVALQGTPTDKLTWFSSVHYARAKSNAIHVKPTNILSGIGTFFEIADLPLGFHDVDDGNTAGGLDSKFTLATIRLNYETGLGELTSITGYQYLDFDESRDTANIAPQYGPVGGAGFRSEIDADETMNAYSQEFRLASVDGSPMTMDGRLDWLLGLYLSYEDVDRSQIRKRRVTTDPVGPGSTSAPLWTQRANRTSYAAFTHLNYALTETVGLTLGGRWTFDDLEFTSGVSNPLGNEPWINNLNPALEVYPATTSNESWDEPTWQISLDYRPVDDLMFYGTYSRGFKSGGFQGDAPTQALAQVPFEPEYADNYELGVKSQLFDNTLQLNLTAFLVDYDDMQLSLRQEAVPGDPTTATQVIINAGSAEVKGAELEVIWLPPVVEGLSLSLTGGVLDTKVKDAPSSPLSVPIEGFDLAQAPDYSATAVALYNLPLSNGSEVDFRLAYRYTGDFWWDLGNVQPGKMDGYGLFDASASYSMDKWRLTLWGQNLNDEEYLAGGVSVTQDVVNGAATNQGGLLLARIGNPRTWGATVSYDFDW